MLRNLLDEMMRRRLLPVAALAVLVAVIAPLLFLKGAPDNAPSADSAAPAAATPAKLPARAARLLSADDGDASKGAAKGAARDPFSAPAAVLAAAASAAKPATTASTSSGTSKSSSGGSTSSQPSKPIPVIIKNPDGTSAKSGSSKSNSSKSGSSKSGSSKSSSGSTASTKTIAVDIRFGAKKDSKIRRAIPRNKAFYIHGKLVAVFVKYSPSRKKATFAVARGLHISGPVKCRVVSGVCRYLDIPAGSHARITMVTANRAVVSRRLDVVHTRARSSSATTRTTAASTRAERACLLGKLVGMKRGDAFINRDACER